MNGNQYKFNSDQILFSILLNHINPFENYWILSIMKCYFSFYILLRVYMYACVNMYIYSFIYYLFCICYKVFFIGYSFDYLIFFSDSKDYY